MNNKTMILHVGVLNTLVLAMFLSMVRRDAEQAREVVDELGDVSKLPWGSQSYSRKDMKLLQETVDGYPRSHPQGAPRPRVCGLAMIPERF